MVTNVGSDASSGDLGFRISHVQADTIQAVHCGVGCLSRVLHRYAALRQA